MRCVAQLRRRIHGARRAAASRSSTAASSADAPEAPPLVGAPPGLSEDDYARALQAVSAQHQPVVELPEALQLGISRWIAGSDPAAAPSSRQLRHSSTRLVEQLRARSRGFPREETESARMQASALGLLPRTRAALAAAAEMPGPATPPPAYRGQEIAAYAASRLPCTYAALRRVLTEVAQRVPGFRPARLLDFGAGPGTAALAVASTWPGALRESVAVEASLEMMALADALRDCVNNADAASPSDAPAGVVALHTSAALPPARAVANLSRLRGPQQQRRYDIVVAAYALGELPSSVARLETVQRLWAQCADVLVILEPGTPIGSAAVREARTAVLRLEARRQRTAGKHAARAAAAADEEGAHDPHQQALHSAASSLDEATNTEGFETQGASGVHVVAPCAHEGRCPMDGTQQWCHFVQRVQRPAVHRTIKGGAPARTYQDERFSFVVLRRGARPARGALQREAASAHVQTEAVDDAGSSLAADSDDGTDAADAEHEDADAEEPPPTAEALSAALAAAAAGWPRVVRAPRKRSGHVVLDLCTPAGSMERRVVAASHAALLGPRSYRLARKARWGDTWPHPAVVRATRIAADGQWVTALEATGYDGIPAERVDTLGAQHLD